MNFHPSASEFLFISSYKLFKPGFPSYRARKARKFLHKWSFHSVLAIYTHLIKYANLIICLKSFCICILGMQRTEDCL